jgi:hypothetical protein
LWSEPGILVEADEAITPINLNPSSPDVYESDDTMTAANTLKIGATPQDHVVVKGDEDWFVLDAKDGLGYIRIGMTGSLNIDEAPYSPGEEFGMGGAQIGTGDPDGGADLLETNLVSITGQAIRWKVEHAYMKITTDSTKPVAYKISFVSELPENRVGGAYSAAITAEDYIFAVGFGDPVELYRATRKKYTKEEVAELRERLFGLHEKLGEKNPSFTMHSKYPGSDPNETEMQPVQYVILSNEESVEEGKHWAFVVNCYKKDGLWLVESAEKDPDLPDKELEALIRRDLTAPEILSGGYSGNLREIITAPSKKPSKSKRNRLEYASPVDTSGAKTPGKKEPEKVSEVPRNDLNTRSEPVVAAGKNQGKPLPLPQAGESKTKLAKIESSSSSQNLYYALAIVLLALVIGSAALISKKRRRQNPNIAGGNKE